jgi:hypothetical protein
MVHADMRSLKTRCRRRVARGCLSENGADCIPTITPAVKVFCRRLIYRRIEQYFRWVYTRTSPEKYLA